MSLADWLDQQITWQLAKASPRLLDVSGILLASLSANLLVSYTAMPFPTSLNLVIAVSAGMLASVVILIGQELGEIRAKEQDDNPTLSFEDISKVVKLYITSSRPERFRNYVALAGAALLFPCSASLVWLIVAMCRPQDFSIGGSLAAG